MSEELKPCPFCGGKGIATHRSGGWTIDCEHDNPIYAAIYETSYCIVGSMSELCTSEQAAATIWNARPIEDALRAEKAEAELAALRAEKAEAELAALREQTRWTPISEMLPEVIEQVLCYAPHYHSIEVRWTDQLGEAVTHWRPLPEPPEDK